MTKPTAPKTRRPSLRDLAAQRRPPRAATRLLAGGVKRLDVASFNSSL